MVRSPRFRRALRAVGIVALALAVCVAGILLGQWQYHRHEARAADIAAFEAASTHAALPLSEVVPVGPGTLPPGALPPGAVWRTVEVPGHFASPEPTWLRNRPVGGTPAVHALGWFLTDDGRALLVDAGWVDARTATRPTLPTGPLTLTVTLRAFESDDGRRDDGATRILPAQVGDGVAGLGVVPGYGVLEQACEPCGALPGLTPTPLPTLSLGPHLAYAWQWWMLAAASIVFAVILLRRDGAAEPGAPSDPSAARRRPARRSAGRSGTEPTDEEIEDAL